MKKQDTTAKSPNPRNTPPDICDAARKIRRLAPGFIPEVGVILGSGLGGAVHRVKTRCVIPYSALAGFPGQTVSGHAGKLIMGTLGGKRIAVMAGRLHLYQGLSPRDVTMPVRLLAALGVKVLLVTAAAGGINHRLRVGDLMIIEDHINFTGCNPLIGEARAGEPVFLDLTQAYSPRLRRVLMAAGRKDGVPLKRGVYLACTGPSYETPAEIRAFGRVGADAVGMSVVPEVIVARAAGLEVCGLCCITNLAGGAGEEPLSHTVVLAVAASVEDRLARLIERFLELL